MIIGFTADKYKIFSIQVILSLLRYSGVSFSEVTTNVFRRPDKALRSCRGMKLGLHLPNFGNCSFAFFIDGTESSCCHWWFWQVLLMVLIFFVNSAGSETKRRRILCRLSQNLLDLRAFLGRYTLISKYIKNRETQRLGFQLMKHVSDTWTGLLGLPGLYIPEFRCPLAGLPKTPKHQ